MGNVGLEKLIFWSGIGHFALCLGSLLIPKVLQWRLHLGGLKPLLRQIFWTYAAYILVINFFFGVISVLGPDALIDHSFLAKSVTLLIGAYWLTRIVIQFTYFDKTDAPKGVLYTVGEVALVAMFTVFALTYLLAFLYNYQWI
ncbi:hypothetical protein [Pseudochryseolinea flava]|uniref:Uncharacterized protein n=1 Tax=Pseudochryseolinea flava TaxID=2059302 RepID=A0A364XU74_9BACT|nr:hypothetical protein [Pseudochryseolinea flava]RAV97712.1 hypothetical protein DQQ10_27115 [Pseudochryseolinea flava]